MDRVTVYLWNDVVLNLDVNFDEPLDHLLAVVAADASLPAAQLKVVANGRPLHNEQTLRAAGVSAGDVVMIVPAQTLQQQAGTSASNPGTSSNAADAAFRMAADGTAVSPAAFIAAIKADPATLAMISQNNPPLAKCIREDDHAGLQNQLRAVHKHRQDQAAAHAAEMALADADPFDLDAQRKIEEMIHKKNIEANLEAAFESNPEVFAQVEMLYVDMEINGVPIKAFVDSGAQMTIMTKTFASKCHLLRLMDVRCAGMAVGVGSARILGRVHQAPLKVGGHYTTTSVTVLEQESGPQFIFGLDMLRRHACSVNLRTNMLHFGSVDASVPFLPAHAIPKDARALVDDVSEQDADRHLKEDGQAAATSASAGAAGSGPPAQEPTPMVTSPSRPMTLGTSGAEVPSSGVAAATGGGQGGSAADSQLDTLLALGFPRDQCVQALQAANGDADGAAAILFGGF